MQLPDLICDFANLQEEEQYAFFLEYYEKRGKEILLPPRRTINKKSSTTTAKPKGKMLSLSNDQLELLKKLNLI